MKSFTAVKLLRLFTFTIIFLLYGCAANQKIMDASGNGANADLQVAEPGICREVRTGRMWQVERSKILYSPQEAEEYAANLELGGHSDWRLPTQKELFSLFYIHYWKKNGDCTMKQNGEYWTAAVGKKPWPGHWETEILCAPIQKYVKAIKQKGYVRAVRP